MDSYEFLNKRVLMTSKARYEASKRLKAQSLFSQWTLAFLTAGQIVLSLLMILKLVDSHISQSYQDMGSLFFSIMILAYSLLLGMGDFSARSNNIHQCGLELAQLSRELDFKIKHTIVRDEKEYLSFVERYYTCLNRYENHSGHDYLIAKLDSNMEHRKNSNSTSKATILHIISFDFYRNMVSTFWYKLKIYCYKFFGFSHYILSIALLFGWCIYITTPQT
jgi:hypothetical protein